MDSEGRGQWSAEVVDLVRGASGGLLFGVPLLYTMEVWSLGRHTEAWQVGAVLVLTFFVLLVLNGTAGFRSVRDVRTRDAAIDSVEGVALGLLLVTAILVLLREITAATPVPVALGKIAYEAMPFCIGVGLAAQFLKGGRETGDAPTDDVPTGSVARRRGTTAATVADLSATVIGSVFIALNVAPTDEVQLLTASMDLPWLLAVMGVSLVASYAIVFAAGFSRQDQRREQEGVLQHPVTETVICYLVCLVSAAVMLWVFQRAVGPPATVLGSIVVLGLPATVGGAAGRLAV